MYVLSAEMEHCEPWVTGVIYIGGAGVALGVGRVAGVGRVQRSRVRGGL